MRNVMKNILTTFIGASLLVGLASLAVFLFHFVGRLIPIILGAKSCVLSHE